MPIVVKAVSKEEYKQWLASKKSAAPAPVAAPVPAPEAAPAEQAPADAAAPATATTAVVEPPQA